MNFIELLLLAIGLAMDTFAVGICIGLTMPKTRLLIKALIVGLYFGIFQAVMPLIGYLAAGLFAVYVMTYSHWIAFILLCFIGGKMIYGSLKKEEDCTDKQASLKPLVMLPLAVATSIDALAIGVSLTFLEVNILPAILLIGIVTLLISMIGVKFGNIFGIKFKSKAEFVGGVILALLGIRILIEGLINTAQV